MTEQHSNAIKSLRLWHKVKFMNGKYFLILISVTVLALYSQYRSISIRVLQCHDTTVSIHSHIDFIFNNYCFLGRDMGLGKKTFTNNLYSLGWQ